MLIMKISKGLQQFLEFHHYQHKFVPKVHYGCFGKGCSHWIETLEIKIATDRTCEFNDCSDDFIISTLENLAYKLC